MKRYAALLPIGALIVGGGLFIGRPKAVTTAVATRGPAIEAVYATGTVEADPRVLVKAKIPGTITRLFVKEGDRVKAGQLLALLDNKTLKYDLERTRADVRASAQRTGGASPQLAALRAARESITADRKLAEGELARAEDLLAKGAITREEIDRRRERLHKIQAEWAAADARIRSLEIDLRAERERVGAMEGAVAAQNADAEVRAPIDGTVIRRRVDLGEAVVISQPLFTIGDTDHLLLEVKIDEADVGKVRVGEEVLIDLYAFPDRAITGRLSELFPDADRDTKTFLGKVEIAAPPDGLRSGMSAEANIVIARHEQAVLAPAGAVVDGKVRVVTDGRVQIRPVEVGLRDPRHLEIVSGLQPGERVVVIGPAQLAEGSRVAAQDGSPPESRKPSTGSGSQLR